MAFEYPKLHLYRASGTCSLVPHILLRHLDIPFEDVAMSFGGDGPAAADGSLDAVAYRRDVNAAAQVPALAVGGGGDGDGARPVVLTQVPALLGYLGELAQQAGHPAAANLLGGRDLLARARVQHWLGYISSAVHAQGFLPGYLPAKFADDAAAHPAIVAKARQKIATAFARLEEELDGVFAVGEGLTVVDFYVYLLWRWSQRPSFKGLIPGEYPRLEALARYVEKLAGVRETLEAEGLDRVFSS